jgi:hypothetical protein
METFMTDYLDGGVATRVVAASEAERLFVMSWRVISAILARSINPRHLVCHGLI